MSKPKEWKFKKKREELIKMVRNALEKKFSPHMAMDLVDACIVASWDYMRPIAKKEVIDDLKQTTLNKHTIRLLEKKHLKPHKEA